MYYCAVHANADSNSLALRPPSTLLRSLKAVPGVSADFNPPVFSRYYVPYLALGHKQLSAPLVPKRVATEDNFYEIWAHINLDGGIIS